VSKGWISKQTVIISLYGTNWLVFITEPDRVYSAVRTGALWSAFVKLRWVTVSFVMSVRPSARPSLFMDQLGSRGTDFYDILYLSILRKSIYEIQSSLKSDNNKWHFTWRPYTFSIISRSILRRMINVSDKIYREAWNTHFMFNNFVIFLFENLVLYGIMKKNIVQRSRPYKNNMAHAHCMLDT
jgi:hypothetical protein